MNDQRKAIFGQRMDIMEADDLSETVADMRHTVIDEMVAEHIPPAPMPTSGRPRQAGGPGSDDLLGVELPVQAWAEEEGVDDEAIASGSPRRPMRPMAGEGGPIGADTMRQIEKGLLLQILDQHWREHLVMLDHLRAVIGFRGYAQKDPLNEYKREAFQLFETLLANLRRDDDA